MWQNKNKKIFGNKKRTKTSLKMGRVKGSLKLAGGLGTEGAIIPVKIILTDFRPSGVDLFCNQDLEVHRELSLTIDTAKKKFFAKGSVIARQELRADAHLIQANRFKFRIGIRFHFESKEQEEEAKQFAHEVNGSHPGGRVDPKPLSAAPTAATPSAPEAAAAETTDPKVEEKKAA